MSKRPNKVELAQPYQARQLGYPDFFRNVSINKLLDASQLTSRQTSANRFQSRVVWVGGMPQFPQKQQAECLGICMVIYARAIYDASKFFERGSKIGVFEIQRWMNLRDIVCVVT